MIEISCQQVAAKLASGEPFLLLDCRETDEHTLAAVPQAKLMPMSEITARVGELDDDRERPIVVMCHHGMRSAQVASWLAGQGFTSVSSMAGGIDRWSVEIDPAIPRY